MAWIIHDFECKKCQCIFEEMYKTADRKKIKCPNCGSRSLKQVLTAANIAAFSIMSPEMKREHLKKRSADHTQKQIDKEPERWGSHGMARCSKKIQG